MGNDELQLKHCTIALDMLPEFILIASFPPGILTEQYSALLHHQRNNKEHGANCEILHDQKSAQSRKQQKLHQQCNTQHKTHHSN